MEDLQIDYIIIEGKFKLKLKKATNPRKKK